MLVGFALTRSIPPRLAASNLLFLTVFSPIVEELEFRGFGFWQLYRRARWPFWLAILPPAILFALGHIEKGQDWRNGQHFVGYRPDPGCKVARLAARCIAHRGTVTGQDGNEVKLSAQTICIHGDTPDAV